MTFKDMGHVVPLLEGLVMSCEAGATQYRSLACSSMRQQTCNTILGRNIGKYDSLYIWGSHTAIVPLQSSSLPSSKFLRRSLLRMSALQRRIWELRGFASRPRWALEVPP